VPDIAHERSFEIGHRGKDPTGDHVNFFVVGLVGHDVGQECHELGQGVAR